VARLLVLTFVGSQAIDIADDQISVGWWIVSNRWGQGYAKEGAAVVVAEAFKGLDADRVLALVQPGNDRSVRVAQGIGMELFKNTDDPHGAPLAV
jgi:RimJ/RimL family protein N-acetyltransferase